MHHLPSRYIPCDGSLTASAYFDPRSPHGERRKTNPAGKRNDDFNPRSPHRERHTTMLQGQAGLEFQFTLPAWGTTSSMTQRRRNSRFQSTLPAGGATLHLRLLRSMVSHFNPRSPQGERPGDFVADHATDAISIHAPRRGSDFPVPQKHRLPEFQSTLPAGGATCCAWRRRRHFGISIHAPRRGSDHSRQWAVRCVHISIHAPRRGSDK